MTTEVAAGCATTELKRRFAFRPELALLYDRQHGLEHRLNTTAVAFVANTFSGGDPVASTARELGLEEVFVASEMKRFWAATLTAHERPLPRRKSGAPADWSQVDIPFPLVLEIELTKVCNWHCDFCYNVWKVPDDYGRRPRSSTGSDPTLHIDREKVFAVLDEASSNNCLRVRLSGGEPTLHPHFREIVAYTSDRGFDIELFSNGTTIDRSMARYLAEHGVRVLLVSVHGLPETQNRLAANPRAFAQAMGAIGAGIAAGMTVLPECLVSEENIGEIPRLVESLAAMGVAHVSFMPYVAYGETDPRRPVALRAIQELISVCTVGTRGGVDFRVPCAPRHCLEVNPSPIAVPVAREFDNHCAAGILWASVSHDGMLRHCPHSGVYAGQVSEGIGRLWRDRIVPTVRAALEPGDSACASCSQFAACQGGCHLGKIQNYPGVPAGRRLPLVPVERSGG